jgi:hypothetical protein
MSVAAGSCFIDQSTRMGATCRPFAFFGTAPTSTLPCSSARKSVRDFMSAFLPCTPCSISARTVTCCPGIRWRSWTRISSSRSARLGVISKRGADSSARVDVRGFPTATATATSTARIRFIPIAFFLRCLPLTLLYCRHDLGLDTVFVGLSKSVPGRAGRLAFGWEWSADGGRRAAWRSLLGARASREQAGWPLPSMGPPRAGEWQG